MAVFYVDAAADGEGDGSSWAEAFDEAQFEIDLEGCDAGDIYYMKAGTYTLDSAYNSSARAGTAVAPVSIIGVKAATTNAPPVIADWGSGADRPVFTCAANTMLFGAYYKLFNLTATGTGADYFKTGNLCVVYNCKIEQQHSSSRTGLVTGTNCLILLTDASATYGGTPTGIACNIGAYSYIAFCYLHDSVTIMSLGGDAISIEHNIVDTATTGIYVAARYTPTIVNNTFYNCTTAISASTSYLSRCINNIIDNCTDAFVWTTQTDINFFAYNHQGNNVTRMYDTATNKVASTLPHTDAWATTPADPKFTTAGSDFSLASDSPCIDAGMTITLGVG